MSIATDTAYNELFNGYLRILQNDKITVITARHLADLIKAFTDAEIGAAVDVVVIPATSISGIPIFVDQGADENPLEGMIVPGPKGQKGDKGDLVVLSQSDIDPDDITGMIVPGPKGPQGNSISGPPGRDADNDDESIWDRPLFTGGTVVNVTATAPIFITSSPTTTPNVTIQGAIVSGSTSTTAQNLGSLTTGILLGTVSGGVNTISTLTVGSGLTLSGGTLTASGTTLTAGTGITFVGGTAVTSNLSTGISGGQTAFGDTGASGILKLQSTTNATRGYIQLGTVAGANNISIYDETNQTLSIGDSVFASLTSGIKFQLYKTLGGTTSGVVVNDAGVSTNAIAGWFTSLAKNAIVAPSFGFQQLGLNWSGTSGLTNPQSGLIQLLTTATAVININNNGSSGAGGDVVITTGSATTGERFRVLNGGTVRVKSLTAGGVVSADTNGGLGLVTIGSGLTFAGGTLSASGTSLTAGTGITITGSVISANLSTGVSAGQSAIGGTGSGEALTLSSTTNATKGLVKISSGATAFGFNEANGTLQIGNLGAMGTGVKSSIYGAVAGGVISLTSNDAGVSTTAFAASGVSLVENDLSTSNFLVKQLGLAFSGTAGFTTAQTGLLQLISTNNAPLNISNVGDGITGGRIVFTVGSNTVEKMVIESNGTVTEPALAAGGIMYAENPTGSHGLVTIGSGLTFSGGTLSATGGASITWPAITDVLFSAGTSTTPIGDSTFTFNSSTKALSAGNVVTINGVSAPTNAYFVGGHTTNGNLDRAQFFVGGGALPDSPDNTLFWISPGATTVPAGRTTGIWATERIDGLTYTGVSSPTITEAASLYIAGAPALSGVTGTAYAVHVAAGKVKLDAGLQLSALAPPVMSAGLGVDTSGNVILATFAQSTSYKWSGITAGSVSNFTGSNQTVWIPGDAGMSPSGGGVLASTGSVPSTCAAAYGSTNGLNIYPLSSSFTKGYFNANISCAQVTVANGVVVEFILWYCTDPSNASTYSTLATLSSGVFNVGVNTQFFIGTSFTASGFTANYIVLSVTRTDTTSSALLAPLGITATVSLIA